MPEYRAEVDDGDPDQVVVETFYRDLQWILFADGTALEVEPTQTVLWIRSMFMVEESSGTVRGMQMTEVDASGFTLEVPGRSSRTDCVLASDLLECLLWAGDSPEAVEIRFQRVGPPAWIPED